MSTGWIIVGQVHREAPDCFKDPWPINDVPWLLSTSIHEQEQDYASLMTQFSELWRLTGNMTSCLLVEITAAGSGGGTGSVKSGPPESMQSSLPTRSSRDSLTAYPDSTKCRCLSAISMLRSANCSLLSSPEEPVWTQRYASLPHACLEMVCGRRAQGWSLRPR